MREVDIDQFDLVQCEILQRLREFGLEDMTGGAPVGGKIDDLDRGFGGGRGSGGGHGGRGPWLGRGPWPEIRQGYDDGRGVGHGGGDGPRWWGGVAGTGVRPLWGLGP